MHDQHPLGTGFTAASTAADVLAGLDLHGTNVIVTGGHGRLGLETTRALAAAGAAVTVAARDVERASGVVAGLPRVSVSRLDLLDPASIDAFVAGWLATERPLHVLVNNANARVAPTLTRDTRGYESQFAAGHLGHFRLTRGLLPALRAARGARVVNVSSGAHRMGEIRWEDPMFTAGDYAPHIAYAQTKKANVLFTVALDRRWAKDGIRGFAVHPGVVIGDVATHTMSKESLRAQGLIDADDAPVIDPAAGKKTIAQGAATIVLAAVSPTLAGLGGVYLKDCDVAPIDDEPRPLTATSIPADACTSSLDPIAAERLWQLSETLDA